MKTSGPIRWAVLGLAWLGPFALSACTALLPEGNSQVGRGWSSFEDARDNFSVIQPHQSTRKEVHALGIDPYENSSVTLLSYSDLVQRFGTGNILRADQLERGVRECLESGRRCTGYQLIRREVRTRRVGSFWLDLLNFRREVTVDGWSFNAVIVFVDELVVMTVYGGQPRIHENTVNRNPLGPAQGMAERSVQSAIQP